MSNKGFTAEAIRVVNFLASMPVGHTTTMERDDLRSLLLETGGDILACGRLHRIKSQDIGAGIYRVSLEEQYRIWAIEAVKRHASRAGKTGERT